MGFTNRVSRSFLHVYEHHKKERGRMVRACARLQRITRANSSNSMSLFFRYLNGVAAESSSAAHVDRPAFLHVEDAAVGLLRLLNKVIERGEKKGVL